MPKFLKKSMKLNWNFQRSREGSQPKISIWRLQRCFYNNNTLFTHATSRSDKNSLKHVRATKSVKKKTNV